MKKIIPYIMLLVSSISYSQDYGNKIDAMDLCSVLQTNSFSENIEAEKGLDRILSVIGASKRTFIIQPCENINNAIATSIKGVRYILYDRKFMNSISNKNNWSNLFILAHEVGHHINGHSLDLVLYATDVIKPESLVIKRQQEIEADEFASFVLAKLGAPIEKINEIIQKVSSNEDDTYKTHPNINKRLNAVLTGYSKANKLIKEEKQNVSKSENFKPSSNSSFSPLINDKIIKEYETYVYTKSSFGEIILETDSNLKVNSFSFENKKQNLLIENNSNQFNSRQKTLIKNLKSGEGYGIKINSLESSNGKILNSNFFFFIKLIPAFEKITNGFSPYKSIYGENIYDDYSRHSIQIKTSSIKDAVILLIDLETGLPIRNVYVNKGTNYTMSNIPPGKYTVKTYQGNYWNSEIIKNGVKGGFQLDEVYAVDSDPDDIWILRRTPFMNGSFTLYSKEGGNLETKDISRQEFFTK
tara:strand:+ start:83 stop:1495 length:1413 start_codon:yes stop_codon:yes gene_type:complete